MSLEKEIEGGKYDYNNMDFYQLSIIMSRTSLLITNTISFLFSIRADLTYAYQEL